MPITPKSVAERNAVIAVKEVMEQVSTDQIVPHEVLKATIQLHVPESQAPGYPYYPIVGKAMEILNSEIGAVFASVNGVGYRRLSSNNAVSYAGERPLNRVRRVARRGYRHLSNAFRHANDLSPVEQSQALQRMGSLALIEHLTMAKTVATMPRERTPPSDPLKPLRDALGV